MDSVVLGALGMGLIIGAIPAIAGGIKGKLAVGFGGFVACVIGSLILGMILSIPLCALFMYVIFQKSDDQKDVYEDDDTFSSLNRQEASAESVLDAAPNRTENNSIPRQIKELAELRDIGILTEEEFQQKKEQLLSRM